MAHVKTVMRQGLAVLVLLCALTWVTTARAAPPDEPWERGSFAGDPRAMLAAAAKVTAPAGSAAVVLLEEGHYSFDAEGRRTYRYRRVYRVLTTEGASSWGTVSRPWAPWHEDRPTIRGRTITPDGKVHEIDQRLVTERPASTGARAVYDDRRVLDATLPAVTAGAVVETEVVLVERQPYFKPGVTAGFFFGFGVPVQRTRLIIEAPSSLPLRTVTRLLPGLKPRRSVASGRVRLVFESPAMPALEAAEPGIPPDEPLDPHVVFSTGASWQAIASSYARIVDQQIARGDVAALAAEVIGKERDPRAAAERALVWMRQRIRYTGLELGAASIVPWTPAETIKRGHGDCKDQATLLVAMLRHAGIRAHVALLDTGPGPDVEETLPGLGWFDHAIVMIEGRQPVWVDPTHPRMRAGQLPQWDQGRRALVAAAGTRALRLTPVARPEDNQVDETRTFTLAEDGPARVQEVTEPRGEQEASYRDSFGDAKPEDVRKWLERYVKDEYLAKELGRFQHVDAGDLTRPFRLEIEASGTQRAVTYQDGAVVFVFPSDALKDVPAAVVPDAPESADKPRKHDYLVTSPHVREVRTRVVLPPGFEPADAPTSEERGLGPAVLSRRVVSTPGLLEVTFRFTLPAARLKPAEFEALRKDVRQVRKEGSLRIVIKNVGMARLEEGRIPEALAEFRRLAALHPREALHRSQAALALLRGGMGEAARAEARAAVALEPGSADAHAMLGLILQHDTFGRRFVKGWDRAGALAAYRKAIELAPDEVYHHAHQAAVHEHDLEGNRDANAADLDRAIAAYRKIREVDADDHDHDGELLEALFRRGRHDEAIALARTLPASVTRNAVLVASLTVKRGVAAAQAEAGAFTSDRPASLEGAANLLIAKRDYTRAADLLAEAGRGGSAQVRQRATLVRRVHRVTPPSGAPRTPAELALRIFHVVSSGKSTMRRDLRAMCSRHFLRSLDDDDAESATDTALLGKAQRESGLSRDVMLDITMSLMETQVDGDAATGWRVRLHAVGFPSFAPVYVVREGAALKILSFAVGPAPLGDLARVRAEAGDLAGAKILLDWARDEMPPVDAADPYGTGPFMRLWSPGKPPDRERIRLAAAVLMAHSRPLSGEALAILKTCPRVLPADPVTCDMALAVAYEGLQRWKDLAATNQRLLAAAPDSDRATVTQITALEHLGRWSELEALAKQRLARKPDDVIANRLLEVLAERVADWPTARQRYDAMIARRPGDAQLFNARAWLALFDGHPTDDALADARRAVILTKREVPEVLHTLAVLEAEAGHLREAHETFLELQGFRKHDEPEHIDWYIVGRIAEGYGLPDIAAAAYRRVKPADSSSTEPASVSTYQLAQRRLRALGQAKGKGRTVP